MNTFRSLAADSVKSPNPRGVYPTRCRESSYVPFPTVPNPSIDQHLYGRERQPYSPGLQSVFENVFRISHIPISEMEKTGIRKSGKSADHVRMFATDVKLKIF